MWVRTAKNVLVNLKNCKTIEKISVSDGDINFKIRATFYSGEIFFLGEYTAEDVAEAAMKHLIASIADNKDFVALP